MLNIELVFDQEDDTTALVRDSLRDALQMQDLAPRWRELNSGRVELPPTHASAPRPAVFVNGQPVGDGPAPSRAQIFMAVQALGRR